MTLIEFFTTSHIDNIAACLRLQPEKLIMVGEGASMKESLERYAKLLQQRSLATKISCCDVSGKDFGDLCALLNRLIREAGNCVIDLTGGDDCVTMALGAVFAELDPDLRRQIRIERFDHKTGAVLDCIHDNQVIPSEPVNLTIEELLALHGGVLYPESYQPPTDFSYRDLAPLWSVVADAPRDWNQAMTVLGEFESRSDSKTHVYLSLSHLRNGISGFDRKENVVRHLLDKLQRRGVIEDRSSRDALEYIYIDAVQRHCTAKAGNVLEVKTLLEGRAVTENGAPFFHDCRMGVGIDWDGIVHHPAQRVAETRNEIDVILMHGATPLFISCKNGNVSEDELYKLHTVAERFGGPHVKKMLVATDLDHKSPSSSRSFIQRAWDMDIFLVTDAAELTHEEWIKTFIQAMQ